MKKLSRSIIVAALLVGCSSGEPAREPASQPPAQSPPSIVATPDQGGNKVLDAAQFADARVREAYVAAKKYAHVLESIYCYCHFKENLGHRALVECFESDHASQCDVCMNEAMIAAKMTEQGKTPKEIQKAIDAFYAG